MGAQVVGRAFARALRQEFAGKLRPYVPLGWELLPQSGFPCGCEPLAWAGCECRAPLQAAVWAAWGTSCGGGQCWTLEHSHVRETWLT